MLRGFTEARWNRCVKGAGSTRWVEIALPGAEPSTECPSVVLLAAGNVWGEKGVKRFGLQLFRQMLKPGYVPKPIPVKKNFGPAGQVRGCAWAAPGPIGLPSSKKGRSRGAPCIKAPNVHCRAKSGKGPCRSQSCSSIISSRCAEEKGPCERRRRKLVNMIPAIWRPGVCSSVKRDDRIEGREGTARSVLSSSTSVKCLRDGAGAGETRNRGERLQA